MDENPYESPKHVLTEGSIAPGGPNVRWLAVLRDIALIWLLTFAGGFVVGMAGATGDTFILAIAASNLLLTTVGFTIAGCLAKQDRFKHLFLVALGLWFTSLVNVLSPAVSLVQWAASIVAILVTMAIGGGLSFLFVKPSTAGDAQVDPENPWSA